MVELVEKPIDLGANKMATASAVPRQTAQQKEGDQKTVSGTPASSADTTRNGGRTSDRSGRPNDQQKRGGLPAAEQAQFDARIQEANKSINALKKKIEILQQELKGNDQGNDQLTSQRQELRNKLQKARAEQKAFQDRRTDIMNNIKGMQGAREKLIEELNATKSKLPYRSTDEIDAAIVSLERHIETGLSLQEEKRCLTEISSLKRARNTVGDYVTRSKMVNGDKDKQTELRDSLKANDTELTRKRAEGDAIMKQLDALHEESNGKFGQVSSKHQLRQKLSKQLSDEYGKLHEIHTELRRRHDEHFSAMKIAWEKREEAARIRRAKEDSEYQAIRDTQAKERALIPPFVDEINTCIGLTHYLSQYVSNETAEVELPAEKKKNVREVSTEPVNDATVLRRGEAEKQDAVDSFFGGMMKKKDKKAPTANHALDKKKSANETLRHSVPIISDFAKLSLQVPNSVSEVSASLKAVAQRKTELEVKQSEILKERMEKLARGEPLADDEENNESKEEKTTESKEVSQPTTEPVAVAVETVPEIATEATSEKLEDGEIAA